ncbi:MAG: HRDC domain-containing protein, partial [Gammaproteobacteria bacterium]|nr:HRDC domain-containing protein [Gammaproteobacteria bacterium]
AARERNLPRQRVLKDNLLLDMVRLRPQDMNGMQDLRGLSEGMLRRDGKSLLDILTTDPGVPPELPKFTRKGPPSPQQAAKLELLNAALRVIANDSGISTGTLAGRRDLDALIETDPDAKVLQGWRRKIVGEPLQKLLRGELALGIRDDHVGLIERLY